MRIQVIHAHPLEDSYSRALCTKIVETLINGGHEVIATDLYADGFAPALTATERRSYYGGPDDSLGVTSYVNALRNVEGLVFCFPQWWFGMPAILKGYFDRVWGPGVAFEHDQAGGPHPPDPPAYPPVRRGHQLRLAVVAGALRGRRPDTQDDDACAPPAVLARRPDLPSRPLRHGPLDARNPRGISHQGREAALADRAVAAAHPRALINRALSRCHSRSLIVSRLSPFFLPLARPSSILARPCGLK